MTRPGRIERAGTVFPGPDAVTALSFGTLLRRAILTVVVPHRTFRRIRTTDTIRAWHLLLVFVGVGVLDILVHFYCVFQVWIFQMFPVDWVAFAAGWVLLLGNVWLLFVLVLALVNRVAGGMVTTVGPLYLASFQLLTALLLVSAMADTLHVVFDLPPVYVGLPGMGWLGGPIIGLWLHVAWFVELPWCAVALWLLLRDVLQLAGTRLWVVTILLVVTLPVGGRLGIEGLPNLVAFLLSALRGWSSLGQWSVMGSHGGGWVILGTQAALMIGAGLTARWWLNGSLLPGPIRPVPADARRTGSDTPWGRTRRQATHEP